MINSKLQDELAQSLSGNDNKHGPSGELHLALTLALIPLFLDLNS